MIAAGSDDGGLQTERTILAWRRTALTAAVVTVLALRAWAHRPDAASLVTLMLSAGLAGVLMIHGSMRERQPADSLLRARRWPVMLSISTMLCATSVWLIAA